jgi:hypothetical protein
MPRPTPTTNAPPRRSSAAQILSLVTGSIVGLLAFGLLGAGGLALWADNQKDHEGYLHTRTDRFSTKTYAIATDNLEVDLGAPRWIVDAGRYGHVRLVAQSRDGKPVFVGIARTSDVSSYLRGTAHATVTDVSTDPFQATYRTSAGGAAISAPAQQRFWAASATGTGTRSLRWKVRDGNWSVVVMNADGSRGVDAGVSAGADVPLLGPVGWGAVGGGLFLFAIAGGLIYLGARAPRREYRSPHPPQPAPSPA